MPALDGLALLDGLDTDPPAGRTWRWDGTGLWGVWSDRLNAFGVTGFSFRGDAQAWAAEYRHRDPGPLRARQECAINRGTPVDDCKGCDH